MSEEPSLLVLTLSIVFLLLLSAFFSGSETALTASTRSRLTGLAMKGKSNANIAIELLNKKESTNKLPHLINIYQRLIVKFKQLNFCNDHIGVQKAF